MVSWRRLMLRITVQSHISKFSLPNFGALKWRDPTCEMASVPAAVALVSVSYLLYRRRSLVAQLSTAAAAHSLAAEESAAEHQRWLLRQQHRAENREAASTARHDSRVPPSRLPLLPIDSSEVDGAGTVLHSRATPGVQRVVLCLVGLGSNKEKCATAAGS